MSLAIARHVLSAVIWVGGMFFAYMAMRPAVVICKPVYAYINSVVIEVFSWKLRLRLVLTTH